MFDGRTKGRERIHSCIWLAKRTSAGMKVMVAEDNDKGEGTAGVKTRADYGNGMCDDMFEGVDVDDTAEEGVEEAGMFATYDESCDLPHELSSSRVVLYVLPRSIDNQKPAQILIPIHAGILLTRAGSGLVSTPTLLIPDGPISTLSTTSRSL